MILLGNTAGGANVEYLASHYGIGKYAIGPRPHLKDCEIVVVGKPPKSQFS